MSLTLEVQRGIDHMGYSTAPSGHASTASAHSTQPDKNTNPRKRARAPSWVSVSSTEGDKSSAKPSAYVLLYDLLYRPIWTHYLDRANTQKAEPSSGSRNTRPPPPFGGAGPSTSSRPQPRPIPRRHEDYFAKDHQAADELSIYYPWNTLCTKILVRFPHPVKDRRIIFNDPVFNDLLPSDQFKKLIMVSSYFKLLAGIHTNAET